MHTLAHLHRRLEERQLTGHSILRPLPTARIAYAAAAAVAKKSLYAVDL